MGNNLQKILTIKDLEIIGFYTWLCDCNSRKTTRKEVMTRFGIGDRRLKRYIDVLKKEELIDYKKGNAQNAAWEIIAL